MIYSVIAIHALGGHAYGSWVGGDLQMMWLRHWLGNDLKNCRIMTYGYDSALVTPESVGQSHYSLLDYARRFLGEINKVRVTQEVC